MIPQLSAATLGTKLIMLATIAIFLIGGGFAGGCSLQKRLDDGKLERADQQVEAKRGALRAAAAALNAASATFRQISRQTSANKALADEKLRSVADEAKGAKSDADRFRTRVAELEQQAERDDVQCPVGRARICGSPLR